MKLLPIGIILVFLYLTRQFPWVKVSLIEVVIGHFAIQNVSA
jgi:hypothetical protein